jgi:hypothetical protein
MHENDNFKQQKDRKGTEKGCSLGGLLKGRYLDGFEDVKMISRRKLLVGK